ncbi:MAG TPA: single-stranded DNA-binding protein [Atribacteraceae bacterium]|nr:single-stranded DNA-binding protein [Atribacteraceae bacterium]
MRDSDENSGKKGKRTNLVQFVGELTRQPRVFTAEGGGRVVNLFVKGDTQRGNVYLPIRVAGDLTTEHYDSLVTLDPGDEVKVLGELDWEKWEKNGETKYATRINARKVKFSRKVPLRMDDEIDSDLEELPF